MPHCARYQRRGAVRRANAGARFFEGDSDAIYHNGIGACAVAANGRWSSFGNNRVHRNGAPGTPPTAIGALTHDVGEQ
jgi:hypothetical protein